MLHREQLPRRDHLPQVERLLQLVERRQLKLASLLHPLLLQPDPSDKLKEASQNLEVDNQPLVQLD
jgi:hypothetical protein